MKKLLSLLVAAVFALSLSVAAFAEDKPADKPPAAHSTKKKAKKTDAEKKAAADKKKAEQDAAKAKGAKK